MKYKIFSPWRQGSRYIAASLARPAVVEIPDDVTPLRGWVKLEDGETVETKEVPTSPPKMTLREAAALRSPEGGESKTRKAKKSSGDSTD